jgi:hypothetical protein
MTLGAKDPRMVKGDVFSIEPSTEAHEGYVFYVDRYVETYPQVRESMHKTARHIASGSGAASAAG